MVFGLTSLNNLFDDKAYMTKPSEMIIHEEWNASSPNHDADVALMITEEAVPFADSIKPVCIWSSGFDFKVGEFFTAGWLMRKVIRDKYSTSLMQIQIGVINAYGCSQTTLSGEIMPPNRTICVIPKVDVRVCIGEKNLRILKL